MSLTLLTVTNHPSGTARVFLQTPSAAMAEVTTDAWPYQRTAVNPADPLQLAVAGWNSATNFVKVLYSIDGGANWLSFSYAGNGEVRQLQWKGVDELVIASRDLLAITVDYGANVDYVQSSFNGTDIMDTFWKSSTEGWALQNLAGGGGFLYYTVDTGNNWTELDLLTLPGWLPREMPRRITPRLPWADLVNFEVFLLSSHVLYRGQHDAAFGTVTIAPVWDYETNAIVPTYPAFPSTGWALGADNNTRFDDLRTQGGRVWLGGFNGLRAHSFDLTNFYLTDAGAINPLGDLLNIWWHKNVSSWEVFAGSSMLSSDLFPYRPGMNYSVDGGVTITPYFVYPHLQRLAHFDAFRAEAASGCTDPDACNYVEDLNLDDGTCMRAVQLRNCATNAIIHSDNPAIVELACRGPRTMLNIESLDPAQALVGIQVFINASLVLNYSATIATSGFPIDRLNEFMQGFIAYVNSTSYRASLVPVGQNTLVPGSSTGVWITSANIAQSGQSVSILTSNVNATAETTMDTGSSGNVVSLLQYPGQCFTVCGQGNCALVETVDLVSSFPDCVSCAVLPTGRICMDCASSVFVSGVALMPNNQVITANCVSQGQQLDIYLRATFPMRQEESFNIVSGGVCGNCPVTFTLQGDKRLFFPVGSTFTAEPDNDQYTVAAVAYDSGTDTTVVVTVETCQGGATFTSVQPFSNCACRVEVRLERWIDGAWTMISSQFYPCEDNRVYQDVSLPITVQGIHRLRIIASDCAETRECIYHMSACGAYSVVQTACHQYELRSGLSTGTESVTVRITDLSDNTVLVDNQQVLITAFPFALLGDVDTVYLVEVTGPDGITWKTEIIDLCDLLACRQKLTLALFCEEDPCLTVMDQAERLSRLELTRISLLESQITNELFTYRYRWTGIPDYSAERILNLQRIASLIALARKISARCSECVDLVVPCTNCH